MLGASGDSSPGPAGGGGDLQRPQAPAGRDNDLWLLRIFPSIGTMGVTFFCKGSYFRNAGSYPVP